MTDPALQLETCELADELRDMLREHLGEDARGFYGDEAVAFVRVIPLDHWLWNWRLEIGSHVATTAITGGPPEDVIELFRALLEAGWVKWFLEQSRGEQ